jgi:hypothetical protein
MMSLIFNQFVEVNEIEGKDQSSIIPSFQPISNPIQNKKC